MEVLQLSVSKRRINSNRSSCSSRSAKLRSRSVDNNRGRSPGKLRLSNSCNLKIINRRNNSLSSRRSVDNSRRSPGKLRLSSNYNMRISNRRNSSLSSRRRSASNLPLVADTTSTIASPTGGAQTISTAEGEPGQGPLSKDEILNCVNGTEQDRPK
jgi:hypothetical protein